jgi:hypothetical protein
MVLMEQWTTKNAKAVASSLKPLHFATPEVKKKEANKM